MISITTICGVVYMWAICTIDNPQGRIPLPQIEVTCCLYR